jgi:hypothetical protein
VKKLKLSENDWLVRLDVGDEIVGSIMEFARQEGVKAASLRGIGAVGGLKYGYFDVDDKEYKVAEESISLEIVSLVGNLARIDGEPILHAHIAVGFPDMSIRGGHLVEGTISVTGEIFVRIYDVGIERGKDEQFGLNLIK